MRTARILCGRSIRRWWRFALGAVVALGVLAGAVVAAPPPNPGGNRLIAFTSDRDGGVSELYTMNAAGSEQARRTTSQAGAAPIVNPAWSPDGSKVAFSQQGIFVFDLATQEATPVTDGLGDVEPAWSPDGSVLAFTRQAVGGEGIWRVDADGGGAPVRLTDGADREPAWSPDGGTIAFTRLYLDSTEFGHSGEDIHLMNPDGSGQVRLTTDGASEPAWSPDGRGIAYVKPGSVQEMTDIYAVGLDDFGVGDFAVGRQMTVGPGLDLSPSWSPDGAYIVFERGRRDGDRNEIFRVDADGSHRETQLTVNAAADRWPDWQPFAPRASTQVECSIADTRVDEGTRQAGVARFEVDCDNPTQETYSLDYVTDDATAQAGSDYHAASGSVAVPPGRTDAQITVGTKVDGLPEPHEQLTVRIFGAMAISRSSATATIVDDDGFGVSVETESVPEGDSGSTDVTLDVSLSDPADQPVTVGFVTRAIGALHGEDYELLAPDSVLTFAPGELRKALSFRVVGDVDFEGDQKVEILPYSRLIKKENSLDGGIWIRDDDEAALSIDDVTVTEGGTATFTVARSHVGSAVEFDFATEDASATAGDDYVAHTGTVAFDDGSPTATVEVPVTDDLRDEPDETFRVRLSNPSNATIADGVGVATIEDDDPEPSLSIDDASAPEGDTGAATAQLRVRLSAPSEKPVTVDYATADGTANAPGDYSAETSRLTIAPGSPAATISIPSAGDRLDEPDETFSVQLSNPSNATISDDLGIATIIDDDPEPSLSIDDVSVSEGDTGTVRTSFAVSLSAPSGQPVSVDYATADGTANAPDDYTALATTGMSFTPGTTTRTVDVTVNGDTAFEGDETFTVGLTGAQNATIADGQGAGTIIDDEAPANDNFADAAPLAAGTTPFDTSFGTLEADEPGRDGWVPPALTSVWYRLSPGRGGVVLHAQSAPGLAQAKRLSVYTGTSLGGLTLHAQNFSAGPPHELGDVDLAFPTADGQQYYVQVIGASALPKPGRPDVLPGIGRGSLTMTLLEPPANDQFAGAAPLTAGTTHFDTSFATVQADEPGLSSTTPAGFPSVWYRLSPGRGVVSLHAETASNLEPQPKRLSIYTGSAVGGLTLVARIETEQFPVGVFPPRSVSLEFPAVDGQEYYVQVLGRSAFPPSGLFAPGVGQGTLTMTFHAAPANDDFSDAAPLATGTTPFDTSFATVETDEPGLVASEPAGFPSVWYRLSPGRGGVVLRAESAPELPAPQAKRLSVYTGTSLSGLTLLARREVSGPFDNVAELELATADGQQYYVQLTGHSALPHTGQFSFVPGVGRGTLSLAFHASPASDDFADAAPLPAGTTPFDTSFATVQADEPGLAGTTPEGFPSAWYRLSPGLGTAALSVEGVPALPGRPRRLSVYRGSGLEALTLVTRSSTPDPFPGVGGTAEQSIGADFRTVCGETYYVQVLGPSAFPHVGQSAFAPSIGQGTLSRQFQPTPPPTNDAFADAATLGEGRTTLPDGWWTCVTAEPGEPAHGGAPAAHTIWYRTTVPSGRVTVDSPGNRVAIYQGSSLATMTRVANGSSGQASLLTTGGTYLVVVDGISGTSVDLDHTPGEVATTSLGTFTTDSELPFDGATPSDPIETTLNGPSGTSKTIFETQGTTAPTAWNFLGWKVEISAPPSPTNPYTLTFLLDASLLTGLTPAQRLQVDVFRNGIEVEDCLQPVPAGQQQRDPCVFPRENAIGGDLRIRIRTTRASEWTLGVPRTTRGTVAGLVQPSSGGDAEFLAASNGTTVAGAFSYAIGGQRYTATSVSALAITGSSAWFAGVDRNGRGFLAYIEDDGPGSSDRFRLWIGGAEQTAPDGRLQSGSLAIRP